MRGRSEGIAIGMAAATIALASALLADPAREAARILEATGVRGGLIVHVGCGDGRLTAALGTGAGYLVHGIDRDPARVARARAHIRAVGLYGKVAVDAFEGEALPYIDDLANLVVGEDLGPVPMDECMRVLAPGGVAYVKRDGGWRKTVKPRPRDIDDWSHFLHDASGNAVARDARVGPPRRMQWLGGPKWLRNHHYLASISAIVSRGGRLFYILDEGPSASIEVPARWVLVARDAFNGVLLWKRPIRDWVRWNRGFRAGPVALPRVLVAGPDRVYLPLGVNAPLSALDAATGETARTYEQTKGTEEVLLDGGVLLVMTGSPVTAQQAAGARGPRPRRRGGGRKGGGKAKVPYVRTLLAIDAEGGRTLWTWRNSGPGNPTPLALASDGARVFFQLGGGVVCLDGRTGAQRWRSKGAGGGERSPVFMTAANLLVADGVVLWADGRTLTALEAGSGRVLWSTPCRPGFKSPTDVFAIGGRVWLGPAFREGLDLRTGRVAETRIDAKAIQTAGHHHRCYREKATERYILTGYRGTEFLDLTGDDHARNNWVRGVCQYGVLPCNGLLYAPPHACGCYMEAKLYGFWALRGERGSGPPGARAQRRTKGPARGRVDPAPIGPEDWPTFLHDPLRSGTTRMRVRGPLRESWRTAIGGRLSGPVVAGDTLLVAAMEAHEVLALEATSGRLRWRFAAGGRIDSPPTIHAGMALFGAADGAVYSLRLADGALVWRFFAAPADRRTVAHGQVESVWPVHGSVLVLDGVAYFAAGRSSYLDGGIALYGLDPRTGRVVCRRTLRSEHPKGAGIAPDAFDPADGRRIVQNATDSRTFKAPDRSDAFSMAGGTLSDVLASDGRSVFMRQVRFDRRLAPQPTPARHLFSTSRLVDDTESHRIHWVLGTGDFRRIPVAYSWIVNRDGARSPYGYRPGVPFAMLLAFDDRQVLGVRRPGGYRGYELTSWKNTPFSPDEPPLPDFRPAGDPSGAERSWTVPIAIRPRALVRARDVVLLGGAPSAFDPADPYAAYEGRKGGLLWMMDARDGRKLAEHALAAPVVWNGMAVAHGRLFLALEDGTVRCMGK